MATILPRQTSSAPGPVTARRPTVMVSRHERHGDRTREILSKCLRNIVSEMGESRFRNRSVLLKPTLQHGRFSEPHHRLTTHPDIVRALVEIFLDIGARVSVGSVGPEPKASLAWLIELAKTHDLQLVDFQASGFRKLASPSDPSRFYLMSNAVLEADGVISCANLQMHRRLRLAGSIKNMMNAVSNHQQAELSAQNSPVPESDTVSQHPR